jgi:CheY-like chemotaxis protein
MVSTVDSIAAAHILRVMLFDVRPERRELMRQLVQGTGLTGIEVGEAGSGAEAVELPTERTATWPSSRSRCP